MDITTREARPDKASQADLWVVGIGTTTDGFDTLREFITHLIPSPNVTYLLALHPPFTFTQALRTLLAVHSPIPVIEITTTTALQANTLYISASQGRWVLRDGRVHWTTLQATPVMQPRIDSFFRGMAHDLGHQSIGVMFCGPLPQDKLGLLEIQAQGGSVAIGVHDNDYHSAFPSTVLQRVVLSPKEIVTLIQHKAQRLPNQYDGYAGAQLPAVDLPCTEHARSDCESKVMEDSLFNEKELAQVTLHAIADGVIRTDMHGKIEYMNPVAQRLTGYHPTTTQDVRIGDVLRLANEYSGDPVAEPTGIVIHSGETVNYHDGIMLRNQQGEAFAVELSASPVYDRTHTAIGVVVVFRDVTAARDLMRRMAWQVRHDPLTGLVNRQELEKRVEQALASAKQYQRVHALLYMDMDQFKIVNDTCGHRAGDELLRQIAGQLALCLRHRDTLARMGGDEFSVLLENCSIDQAQAVAEKMKDTTQSFRFMWEEKIFKVGMSVGVVGIDSESESVTKIFSDADAACYAAKDAGRNRVLVHSHSDSELAARRDAMHWAYNINQLLDEDRFSLYYQQITPLTDTGTPHWEVLLRMQGKDGQLILPGVFLPAAERYGLMLNVDRWVLKATLHALADAASGIHHCKNVQVAINISASSLADEQFLHFAKIQFEQSPIKPSQVCFEITETAAIANFTRARLFISEMKKLGCRFALDDFGSGMSSFGYLRSLPVDFLKIDGSFVRTLATDAVNLATVECINRIGHLMGMQTVAEFVEDEHIMARLRAIGVDYAQGYAVHVPVPYAQFVAAA
ncbi:MAG: EAL domain-containing protein [Gammaproteobacteria bacterium]|nr:EAL domain-containing protein [Gammaproteobacteria bacterium]